jgi:hypothetical protein
MGLVDDEGQGITPETLSKVERRRYEYDKREAEKCKNLHQIEAYAYARLLEGFSDVTITGTGELEDGDFNILIAFSSIFDPVDLPPCPWPEVSEDRYSATHKLFRSPWIARAADALGSERFHSLALQAVDVTRDLVAEQATYCDEDMAALGWHEKASLVHDEILKHYPRFADAFDPYPPEEAYNHDWSVEESIKITTAEAYAVNRAATIGPRASNPSPTPRQQTGGSDSDGDGDGDGGDGEPPRRPAHSPTPPLRHSLTHSLIFFFGGA